MRCKAALRAGMIWVCEGDNCPYREVCEVKYRIAELEAENRRLIELLTRYHNEDYSSFYGAKQATIMEVREAIASGKDGTFVDDDPNDIMTPENLEKHSCIEAAIAFEKAHPSIASGKDGAE